MSQLKAVRQGKFLLTQGKISLLFLSQPSTDRVGPTHIRVGPTHIRVGNLLYPVYRFMFNQMFGHPVTQSS